MNIRRKRPAPSAAPQQYSDLASYFAETHDTQVRVAEAVGATQAQISRIKRGQTMPRPALALRLAAHCHIPLDSLITTYRDRSRHHGPRTRSAALDHSPGHRRVPDALSRR